MQKLKGKGSFLELIRKISKGDKAIFLFFLKYYIYKPKAKL